MQLVTDQKFSDFELHIEFQGTGNSGVYLQGRYEIQIDDSFDSPKGKSPFTRIRSQLCLLAFRALKG